MNKVAMILLLLVGALALTPSFDHVLAENPVGTPVPDHPTIEPDMPPLDGGSPYAFPIIPSPPHFPEDNYEDEPLAIDVWNGAYQHFGQLGTPQTWLNIVGSVRGPRAIESLTYSLNDGPEQGLSLGADRRRLFGQGDFNIELDYRLVAAAPSSNTVRITADDGQTIVTQDVVFTYEPNQRWPLPYTADWSAVSAVADGGQIVDGAWRIGNGLLQNVVPGYDRLVAIGDMSWTDYEVTVPVTVHAINTAGWRGPSNGAGVGIIARWSGHYAIDDEQPRLGWRNLGALAWYHWSPKGNAGFELRGQGGGTLASRSNPQIQLDVPYVFKLRVESLKGPSSPATYSFKFWKADEAEPEQWTLQAAGKSGDPQSGSLMLVAHQVDVSFGNVTVVPVTTRTVTVALEDSLNGTIEARPTKPVYQAGEQVEFVAIPAAGFRFSGWTGDLGGANNPHPIILNDDMVVGALFEPDTLEVFVSPSGSGSVDGLSYSRGDILQSGSSGNWTQVLAATNSPLGGRSDIEAFTLLEDGSLLVALARPLVVEGLGMIAPSDILRIHPDVTGGFSADSTVELLLDGSTVALTTAGEKIDALAVDGNSRLLISISGTGKVFDSAGNTITVRDEDLISYGGLLAGDARPATWELICDGSRVPGLGVEDIVGLSVDAGTGRTFLSLAGSFKIAGTSGSARDIISLSDCTTDATSRLEWNSRDAGFNKPFDAMAFRP